MESIVRKSNKENTRPVCGPRKHVLTSKPGALSKPVPLQSKNALKEDHTGKDVLPKVQTTSDPAKRHTLSQAFRSQQSVRHRALVEDAQKPLPAVSTVQNKPGTYKGRVVQSKIDCFRKPSAPVKTTKPSEISKPELPKVRSRSVTSLVTSTKPESRSKSVSEELLNATGRPVHKSGPHKPIPKDISASQAPRVGVRPRPGPSTTGRSALTEPPQRRETHVTGPSQKRGTQVTGPSQKRGTQVTGPPQKRAIQVTGPPQKRAIQVTGPPQKRAIQVTGPPQKSERQLTGPSQKRGTQVTGPPQRKETHVTGPISQYRVQVETAQERRVKLAAWLASKGKTLKRPPISGKMAEATRAAQSEPEENTSRNQQPQQTEGPDDIMMTSLHLLDSSEVESVVLNLCDRLEAMECGDDVEKREDVQVEQHERDKLFEILEEEDLASEEDPKAEVKSEDLESCESEDEESDTPPMAGASVVKYSVKTTPYLQSVKKRMETEGSGSRRKSTINELKFLTPVRRSTRIQRKSSRLPAMLADHDSCVSSLAELVQMDDAHSSAYIYRKNPALLEDLPDRPGDVAKVCS